mmetsp:Transcript_1991/g.4406  ORF Transcript_1991/g.4406 Transcript_1991/m.4406 type:complete len:248 (-) Transcript_1991:229-972(-)
MGSTTAPAPPPPPPPVPSPPSPGKSSLGGQGMQRTSFSSTPPPTPPPPPPPTWLVVSAVGEGCSSSASSCNPSRQMRQKMGSVGSGAELTAGDNPSSYIPISFMYPEEGNSIPVRRQNAEMDSYGSDDRALALSWSSSSRFPSSFSSSLSSRSSSSSSSASTGGDESLDCGGWIPIPISLSGPTPLSEAPPASSLSVSSADSLPVSRNCNASITWRLNTVSFTFPRATYPAKPPFEPGHRSRSQCRS